jgi:hypothetical protein
MLPKAAEARYIQAIMAEFACFSVGLGASDDASNLNEIALAQLRPAF